MPSSAVSEDLQERVSIALQTIQRDVETFNSRLRLLGTPRDTGVMREKL
jgi:hypothetical protein